MSCHIRVLRLFSAALMALLLAACANISSTPAGTPVAEVIARFGEPDLRCRDRNGHDRAIWSQQPMGQQAWATTIDGQGRTGPIHPVLTDEHFAILAEGHWTAEQLRCEFGPPAIIDTAGLPGKQEIVWSYRYRQNGFWNSLMYVFMGRDGQAVTRFHPGPDPMYLRMEDGWWW